MTESDGRIICSSRGCRETASWKVVWNNPRLHTPDREKVWTACDEHRATLSEYLSLRSMLRRVEPLDATGESTVTDASPASVDVLTVGYADDRVAGTVTLVRDGATVIVVDPGMVAHRSVILDPLAALAVAPDAVTDVVLSHHHPDHTINIALFPNAKVHDFATTYDRDRWIDREPGAFDLSPSVRLLPTPGHTDQDQSTIVRTDDGVVVLTHLWWMADGPAEDPFSRDQAQLRASRELVLELEPALIVPGHGPAFHPTGNTPL